jgi:alcohol dehydrogenase class IV
VTLPSGPGGAGAAEGGTADIAAGVQVAIGQVAIGQVAIGRLPRITFGAGVASRLPSIVAGHGRRALLVRGAHSLAAGGKLEGLRDALADGGVELVGEAAVDGEPSPALVDAIAAAHRGDAIEVVLGIGGGSALDTAKAVSGLLRVDAPVTDFLEGLRGARPWPGPSVPLVAVPTTAGTGSEATRNAVISERGPGGYKRSFRDERLVPADAVVDPDLLAGLPPDRIAQHGMDALAQLLESYVSLRAGAFTDALAISGLAAARDGLLAWHASPEGPGAPAARERMAWAALLSGICLANAGLGGVHGLASPLGAQFPIPHGLACGATLAPVTAANVAALEQRQPDAPAFPRYAVLGRLLARLPEGTPDHEATAALVDLLGVWTQALRIPGLATWGITEAAIPAIIADARGSSMRTNPIVLTDGELARILTASL